MLTAKFMCAAIGFAAYTAALPTTEIASRQGNIPFLNACEQGCTTCEGAIRAVELSQDNSQCTSFNSAETFPDSYQTEAGGWNVFLDTNGAFASGFVTTIVVRSPAGTDVDGCGVPTRVIKGVEGCYQNTLSSSFLLQYCQSTNCDNIVPSSAEFALADRLRAESPTGEPNITAWNTGLAEIKKRELAARELKELLTKRDGCENLSKDRSYTKLSDKSYVVSPTQSCAAGNGGTCDIMVGQTQSVSYTLSVEMSVGIEGLFSTTFGFSLENTQESTISETFSQGGGTTGYVSWTPILQCGDGTLSGCSGGVSDGPVTGCSAKMIMQGSQSFMDGVYSFVSTS